MEACSISTDSQRRLRVSEYHRMIDAGVFDEDEHLELLAGFLVRMSPQGALHARTIQRLNRLLVRALGDDHVVRPQLPLTLGEDAEPEPDLAVVVACEADSAAGHPHHAILVVEVAADSLERDRGVKAALYARAGIPDYWIVNLAEGTIEVYRDPEAGRYRSAFTRGAGAEVALARAPHVVIRVDALLA